MRLSYFPSVGYFVLPMGLLGAGLNAQHLTALLQLKYDFSMALLFLGWISYTVIMIHYIWHLVGRKNRQALIQEWYDPFRRSFLPAITLTSVLFILSIAQVLNINQSVSSASSDLSLHYSSQFLLLILLLFVAALHLLLNVFLINGWLFDEKLTLNQHKPTWYILLSGNFIIVIALNSEFIITTNSLLYELSMFFYAIGLFFWVVFSSTLFYRLIFNSKLQTQLRPSLFIFLAPSSLACVASILLSNNYMLTGSVHAQAIGIVTWLSFSFASTMLIAWLLSFKFFISSGLSMAGWSFVYPLAAYGLAAQYLAYAMQSTWLVVFSVIIFVSLVVFILLLSYWLIKLSMRSVNVKAEE